MNEHFIAGFIKQAKSVGLSTTEALQMGKQAGMFGEALKDSLVGRALLQQAQMRPGSRPMANPITQLGDTPEEQEAKLTEIGNKAHDQGYIRGLLRALPGLPKAIALNGLVGAGVGGFMGAFGGPVGAAGGALRGALSTGAATAALGVPIRGINAFVSTAILRNASNKRRKAMTNELVETSNPK